MASRKLRKLVKKYASASWEDRKSAIEEMANLGHSEAVGTFVSALADAHPEVRAAAERALPTASAGALALAIASAPDSARHIVVKAVGLAKTAELAREVIRGLVKDSELGDYMSRNEHTPEDLAFIDAMALQMRTMFTTPLTLKALKAAARDPLPAVQSAASEAAGQVAEVLGVMDAAIGLLAAPEAVRLAARRSLGPNPSPEAVMSLLKRRQDALDQLPTALRDGDVQALEEALRAGATLNVKFKDKSSALHVAASHGHTGVIAFLLKKGQYVDAADDLHKRPLHLAASRGFPGAAGELLKGGASLEAKTMEGQTPLHAAAKKGHVDVVQLFLDTGAKVNAIDDQGRTPLALAEAGGHTETADLLRQRGGSLAPPAVPTAQGAGCCVMFLLAGTLITLLGAILR